MAIEDDGRDKARRLEALSTLELLEEIAHEVERLAKTELALARTELRADLVAELKAATGLGLAAVAGFLAVSLLLVTAVLALANVMPAWLAGLAVSASLLVVAGAAAVTGWRRRVKAPLARTLNDIKEDVRWTKNRLA